MLLPMMMFSGCASSDKAGAPPLTVAIPASCERILAAVAVPDIKSGEDARAALAETRSALTLANLRLARGRSCFATVRARFASGK